MAGPTKTADGQGHEVTIGGARRLPRICRGLALIAEDDWLIFEGSLRRVRLTGAAITDTMPKLLPLLDGRHDLDTICAELDLERQQADLILNVLETNGLIELVPPDPRHAPAAEHVRDYLSRTARATGGHLCAEDVAVALAETAILLVGPSGVTALIATDLAEMCVGSLAVRASADSVTPRDVRRLGTARRSAAAVLDSSNDTEALDKVTDICRASRIPVLRFAAGPGYLEVGPLFHADEGACSSCFVRGYRAMSWPVAGEYPQSQSAAPTALAPDLVAALVTGELLAVTAQLTPPVAPGRMYRFRTPNYAASVYDVLPDSGCADCGPYLPADDTARHVEAYERQVRLRPAELKWRGESSESTNQLAVDLQLKRDRMPSSPRQQLPDVDVISACASSHGSRSLDDVLIAGLVRGTAGFRDEGSREDCGVVRPRWVPSGGNVGSVEIYLVSDDQLFNLPGTIYKYDDINHQVVSITKNPVPIARILAATDLALSACDLVLVMTGAVGRLSQKYGEFGLRLAHLDAGCAALQLTSLAAVAGLTVSFASEWSHELADVLELQPHDVVTAIAAVRAGRPRATGDGGNRWA